jgi:hypothetical protein
VTGVLYTNCTGNFPYMSLDGNVHFFGMYHYNMNAILFTLILGLDSERILEAYSKIFGYLVSKGKEFKPKVNIMDNQATKAIKTYLTPQQVTLQLVEPHNHRVNAAEQAIQTFKNRLIGTLGSTNSKFPIQLWDKLAPQVQDCINLLRCSLISPTKLALRRLKGRMTTIVTLSHPLAPEQSFTKIQTQGPLGPHTTLTHGTWNRPKTITNATFIMYLKQGDTEFQDQRIYSHNAAESPRTHLSRK